MKRAKSSPEEEEEKDRISSLPDSLIHHILSFMEDTMFAVQTCVLSKRWRYICTSLPVLKFSDDYHYVEKDDEDDIDNEVFIKFVNEVLNRHDNSNIQRFHLDCSTYYAPLSVMYGWITTAVKHNVEELYIETNREDAIRIPPCLCTCKSLTKMALTMSGWEGLFCKIILPRKMSLPQLKSLRLTLKYISFDDEKLVNRFFSSFPSLESLIIMETSCLADMNLNISLPKLEYFEFHSQTKYESNCEIKLHAPSLTSFIFDSYLSTSLSLENLSSLVTADIKICIKKFDEMRASHDVRAEKKAFYAQHALRLLRGIHNVKVLRLNKSFLKALGGTPYISDTQLPGFCNLQHLKLETYLSRECMHPIIDMLKNSPNLESISLDIRQLTYGKPPVYPYCDEVKFSSENTGDYWEAGLSLPCILYHLKVVEIYNILGCVNELKFLEILMKHALVLEKVVLVNYSFRQDMLRVERVKKFSEMVLKLPRASKNIIILSKF